MRIFDWEDGFTPYSATLDGDTLTEYAGDIARDPAAVVERCSTVTRRPEWDGHPNAADYTMSDDFSAGEVGGVDVVWVDGLAYTLTPVTFAYELRGAIASVTADQREGDPDATAADAVAHVRGTLILPGLPSVAGAVHLDGEDTDPSYLAYVAVLTASDEDIAAALTR